jgi:YVTN family beta-propeller protein
MNRHSRQAVVVAAILACACLATGRVWGADIDDAIAGHRGQVPLPTGQYLTPLFPAGTVQSFLNPGLARYPHYVAGEAVKSALSPDGKTLLTITAGYNLLFTDAAKVDAAASTQFIFVHDVSGAHKTSPVLEQVLQQTNAGPGIAWAPDGSAFYAAGGVDDAVYVYTLDGRRWSQAARIPLGHAGKGIGLDVEPNAAGLALTHDGKTLVVANNFNDSISVIDTANRTVRYEHDLRPFSAGNEGRGGVAGGEYPFAVVIKDNAIAYVSSVRDREVVAVDVSAPGHAKLVARIKVDGNPNGMALNRDQTLLYVAQDNADQVAVVDTATNAVGARIDTRAPAGILAGKRHTGAAPDALALAPDGRTLYVVNGGANSVAVVALSGPHANTVQGLVPTAWYPHDIALSADGSWMYIVNGKSDPGANPRHLSAATRRLTESTYPKGNPAAAGAARASNEYVLQLHQASLVSAQVPAAADLPALTRQVAANNRYTVAADPADDALMSFLRGKISHVIYVIKENRTYDQVLGDLGNGANGDPSLTVFGRRITPNQHAVAADFVTLDNFFDSGDVSMDGWSWTTQARVTDDVGKTVQLNYAGRGLAYETEGANRNVPTGLPGGAERRAAVGSNYATLAAALPGGPANLLPGTADVAATDAPAGVGAGYLWDAAIAKRLTVRNYGVMTRNVGTVGSAARPISNPFASGVVQSLPLQKSLAQPGVTDEYFRGFDTAYPDCWRVDEWKREFDRYAASGKLPALTLLRLGRDHMGRFAESLAESGTPEQQVADNDWAFGRVVDAVAHSRFAADTLIFAVEDDAQDGPDHVDAHRSTAYVVGPYVKHRAVVGTRYSTVNLLRTIEDVLGLDHLNLNDAYQRPMTEVFDPKQADWTFEAVAPAILKTTTIARGDPGLRFAVEPQDKPRHNAAYWARATRGFDFSDADRVPAALFNEVVWKGLMDGRPYPAVRSGESLGRAAKD